MRVVPRPPAPAAARATPGSSGEGPRCREVAVVPPAKIHLGVDGRAAGRSRLPPAAD